MTLIKIKV